MSAKWLVIAVVSVLAVIALWYIWNWRTHLNKLPKTPAPDYRTIQGAPGVDPTTGNTPTAQPNLQGTAAPRSVLASKVAQKVVRQAINPSAALENVPIAGTAIKATNAVIKKPAQVVNKINTKVNAAIEHIPVVGKAAAAPLKAANKVASVFTSLW